ncbi:lumazine-binding protein [Mycobacterium sp. DL592]|uniref:Rv0361 family membrane protein n=1 Tax=Mycobacterium sp. DL592 TaxID=2675524 RepID=UPI00142410E2|nr:lumazine-binding protein [Mycobacterium sp. DL592]
MTDEDNTGSSPMPILIALGVAAIVLIGFGISWLIRGDGMTEDTRVGRAAVGQNDALQRENYPDFRKYTCAAQQATEADVLAHQQQSKSARGARYVDDVTGVKIDGDRATATVVYHFERTPDKRLDTPMTFVRESGDWKVCSPSPA